MVVPALAGLILGAGAALAQTAEPPAEQPATPAADFAIDTPLAEVNGTTLTLGELIAIRRELPEQYQALPDEVLMGGILEQMIDQMLLAEAASAAGLDQRPAVAMSLVNQRRAILADAYLSAEVAKRATPEAVEALYNERYVEAEPVDEVKAGHILVESEELAREIKAQLDAGGDFAELAKEHGTDGTKSRGGDLGWFVHSDMVPEFADAVFAMQPGTVSDPVKTAFGWHIIKLDERRPRAAPALEEVRAELEQEVARNAQVAIVEELRAKAQIEKPEAGPPPAAIRADGLLEPAE
jgi:peptidyl-prolyl cis-trans isomerase C